MSTSTITTSLRANSQVALPPGLREAAAAMSWECFVAAYANPPGPVRLGQWACTEGGRPATRLGPCTYQARIAVGDRIGTATAEASGPLAALTAMLYERGVAVEMLRFHQLRCGERTATFIEGSGGARAEWAMGWAPDATESALRAVIACANRLLTA